MDRLFDEIDKMPCAELDAYLRVHGIDTELFVKCSRVTVKLAFDNLRLRTALEHIQKMADEEIRTGKGEGTLLYQIEADARAALLKEEGGNDASPS